MQQSIISQQYWPAGINSHDIGYSKKSALNHKTRIIPYKSDKVDIFGGSSGPVHTCCVSVFAVRSE